MKIRSLRIDLTVMLAIKHYWLTPVVHSRYLLNSYYTLRISPLRAGLIKLPRFYEVIHPGQSEQSEQSWYDVPIVLHDSLRESSMEDEPIPTVDVLAAGACPNLSRHQSCF